MTRLINFFKVIRNNWKKSIVGAAAFSYGVSYSIDAYDTERMMREYCQEAVKYGNIPIPANVKPRHVTVILNPVSKRRKAKKLFEKYCEPLLHLAGIAVTVVQTESENHARQLIMDLHEHTDAIVVAGGDGTLSDVITGLMRKYESNPSSVKNCPVGILPIGQTNRVADSLFNISDNINEIQQMVNATMAVVKETTKMTDILEVVPLENDPENPIKSVYAVGVVEWGAWKDAHSRINRYWYWGPLRRYVTYVFNGHKNDLNWSCNGVLRYSDPCSGCFQCYQKHHAIPNEISSGRRWWHAFIPNRNTFSETNIDYSKITNENCGKVKEMPISATELNLFTNIVKPNFPESAPSIKIELGPNIVNYANFVSEGWRRVKGNKTLVDKTLEAKEIELHLDESDYKDKERSFYIDNEEFELKPLKIKLLPRAVKMFCSTDDTYKL